MREPGNGAIEGDDVQAFVLQFLRTCGASFTSAGGVWKVRLPKWVVEALNVPQETIFTFDRTLAGPDVIVIAHGSPVLDAMIHLARQRGTACTLMFSGLDVHRQLTYFCTTNPWSAAGKSNPRTGALRRVHFKNARVRSIERRVLHQEELLFHFKVAYVSDERIEESHTLLMNPMSETVAAPIELRNTVVVNLPSHRRRTSHRGSQGSPEANQASMRKTNPGASSYAASRAYRIACEHLEELIGPQLQKHISKAQERLKNELIRIEAYYRGVAVESVDPLRLILRKIEAYRARSRIHPAASKVDFEGGLASLKASALQLEAAYREELGDLEIERERRISELQERYKVRVEVELTNVAVVRVPRIEWSLRLAGPTHREITLLHDVLRDFVMDFECDVCEKQMYGVWVCANGDAVCEECNAASPERGDATVV